MRWLPAILMVASLAAACGGGGTSSGSSPATTATPALSAATASQPAASGRAAVSGSGQGAQEACRLVTRAEVEAATGLKFGDGAFKPGGMGGGVCFFEQQVTSQSGIADLVGVEPFSIRGVYEDLRESARLAVDVAGLGDRAFVDPNQIVVQKGNQGVLITWQHVTSAPRIPVDVRQEKLIALARVAVDRM